MCRLLCLVLGAGAWEQDRPEKAGVSESRGRGLPALAAGACPRTLGPTRRPAHWGNAMPKGLRPGYLVPELPPLTFWVWEEEGCRLRGAGLRVSASPVISRQVRGVGCVCKPVCVSQVEVILCSFFK